MYFVAPAWRRLPVGRLCFAQWAGLFEELAARGLDARAVVIADDANLDSAQAQGFETIEMDNSALGARFNAGFKYAGEQGADWIAYVGSDNWLHHDLFEPLLDPGERRFVVGREIAFVDLPRGALRRCWVSGDYGVIPWLLPAEALAAVGYAPMENRKQLGLDWHLMWALREQRPGLLWHDPHPLARVDFKSSESLTPFAAVAHFGGREEPLGALAELYPAELVELARATHEEEAAYAEVP